MRCSVPTRRHGSGVTLSSGREYDSRPFLEYTMPQKHFLIRLRNFVLTLGTLLCIIYVGLPLLTQHIPILHKMSVYLDNNGIDPTRYYYTDVEQVKESESYIYAAIKEN